MYHAGGGVKYFFVQRPRGFFRGLGLRGDGRVYVRSGGVELDEDTTRRNQWAVCGAAGALLSRTVRRPELQSVHVYTFAAR